MLERLIHAAVGVVGLALIGLAIASATVWRADDVLRAAGTADQAIVVTDPGVLEMGGDPVTVTARVPSGARVVLAIGRDADVAGWVGTDDHQRVTGLAGWHELALAAPGAVPTTSAPTPSVTPAPAPDEGSTATVPDPAGSDMWLTHVQGTGEATLTWQAEPGRWSLLAVGVTAAGAPAPPTLELAWPRAVTTPYLVPGTVAGGILLLAALALLGRDLRRRQGVEWTPVLTEQIPVVGEPSAQPLTRRQVREMQAAALAARRGGRRADESPSTTSELRTLEEAAPATGAVPLAERPTTSAPAQAGPAPAPAAKASDAKAAAATTPAAPVASAKTPESPEPPTLAAPAREPLAAPQPAPTGRRALRTRPAWAPSRDEADEQEAATTWSATAEEEPAAPRGRRSAPSVAQALARPAPGETAAQTPPAEPEPPAWAAAASSDAVPPAAARATAASSDAVPPAAASTAQPSWLRRVTGTTPAPPTPPASQPEPEPASAGEPEPGTDERPAPTDSSRADAWRRAWGLPPLEMKDDDDGSRR